MENYFSYNLHFLTWLIRENENLTGNYHFQTAKDDSESPNILIYLPLRNSYTLSFSLLYPFLFELQVHAYPQKRNTFKAFSICSVFLIYSPICMSNYLTFV